MRRFICFSLFFLLIQGIFSDSIIASEPKNEIVMMTHDSFNVSKSVIEAFEIAHKTKVTFLKSGDAGAALNYAILSKNNPIADVFYGVDNSFLSRALEEDIFIPYTSPLIGEIYDNLKLDPLNRLLPVDYGDVCINYDKKWFREKGIKPPSDLPDLLELQYKGLTVVENPATSSPGLAFLLATIGRFGDPGYLDYWRKLGENDVMVTNGWEDAYWGQFSAASEGSRPIVVSYASSPAAEVFFSSENLTEPPTGTVIEKGSVFRQIEYVGILKGTKKRQLAEKLVDFLLDKLFQEDIPLQMFVFPANKNTRLPEIFEKHAKVAEDPVQISPDEIMVNRDKWIMEWTKTVLR